MSFSHWSTQSVHVCTICSVSLRPPGARLKRLLLWPRARLRDGHSSRRDKYDTTASLTQESVWTKDTASYSWLIPDRPTPKLHCRLFCVIITQLRALNCYSELQVDMLVCLWIFIFCFGGVDIRTFSVHFDQIGSKLVMPPEPGNDH